MDTLSSTLSAISHPTRRAILQKLSVGPSRFIDIAEGFDTALNATTKHLKILERARLIEKRREGREVRISLRAKPLAEISAWVHEYQRFWKDRLDQFEQHFNNRKKKEIK